MSLKTWKNEFYPCEANSYEAAKDPIGHSLRKWEGLLKKNMRMHGVDVIGLTLGYGSDDELEIDADSCALCEVFYNEDAEDRCASCPIVKATGYDCLLAFDAFSIRGDAQPMVNLLRKTKKFAEKEKANG